MHLLSKELLILGSQLLKLLITSEWGFKFELEREKYLFGMTNGYKIIIFATWSLLLISKTPLYDYVIFSMVVLGIFICLLWFYSKR